MNVLVHIFLPSYVVGFEHQLRVCFSLLYHRYTSGLKSRTTYFIFFPLETIWSRLFLAYLFACYCWIILVYWCKCFLMAIFSCSPYELRQRYFWANAHIRSNFDSKPWYKSQTSKLLYESGLSFFRKPESPNVRARTNVDVKDSTPKKQKQCNCKHSKCLKL